MKRWTSLPLALAASACAVPWLMSHVPALALALQRGFSLVCHQHADRSFAMFGGAVAICSRCLGIYLGAAAGLMLRVPRRLEWRFLLMAIAANLLDSTAEVAGMHGNWMFARFVLGFVLGLTGAMLVRSSMNSRLPVRQGLSA